MRTGKRPRKYVGRIRLTLVRPLFRYSTTRDAYVLRVVGGRTGPVLLADRRLIARHRQFEGADRRRQAARAA